MRCRDASFLHEKYKPDLQLSLPQPTATAYDSAMSSYPAGTIAVIFVAQRTADDDAGYAKAAQAMDKLAREQTGYVAIDSVRDADGLGITVSYWADEAATKAWRDHPEHTAIRDAGRGRWYSDYSLHVAAVTRSYDWSKPGSEPT